MALAQLQSERQVITADFVLDVEQTAKLVQSAAHGKATILILPLFGHDMWSLMIQIVAGKNDLGLYLKPQTLKKQVTVKYKLSAYVGASDGPKLAEHSLTHAFPPTTESTSTWGLSAFCQPATLRRIGQAKLALRAELTIGDGEEPPAPPALSDLFNEPSCCDLVLSVRSTGAHLFVHEAILRGSAHFRTALDSDFEETSKITSLPPIRSEKLGALFLGDPAEFSSFVPDEPAIDLDTTAPGTPEVASDNSAPNSPAGTAENRPLGTQCWSYRSIEVDDCSFATLRAFVYFLYSGSISFLPSLALFLADQAAAGKHPRKDDAQKWLTTKEDTKDVAPVSPHALYRFTDCYLHAELKRLAKNAILESITVESAPFELFSDLSRQYEDFRESILNFVQANLALMKATPGWKLAIKLIDEGEILGAGTVLDRLT